MKKFIIFILLIIIASSIALIFYNKSELAEIDKFVNSKILALSIYKNLEIPQNNIIDSYECIGELCEIFRVKLNYIVRPENELNEHSSDYFFFINNNKIEQIIYKDYPDNPYTGDFEASFIDVTFDGNKDLLIHLGNDARTAYYTAYVYEDGGYKNVPTFEEIPSYEIDNENKVITGRNNDSYTEFHIDTRQYKNGKFELIERTKYVYNPERADFVEQ